MNNHLGAHPGQGTAHFGKPHVIADTQPETPHVRHVEHAKVSARLGLFQGLPGKHLAVTGHYLPGGRNSQGCVVNFPVRLFILRTGNQPFAVLFGQGAKPFRHRPRDRFGVSFPAGIGRAEHAQFAKDDHIHKGIIRGDKGHGILHAFQVFLQVVFMHPHLHAGDGKISVHFSS